MEYKKRQDDEAAKDEAFEETKKKLSRDLEALQQRIDSLVDENDKMNKSKKKLQSEVSQWLV